MHLEMWNPTAKRTCDKKSVTSASDVNSSHHSDIESVSSIVPSIDLIISTSFRLLLVIKTLRERRDYAESVLYPATIYQLHTLHSVGWDVNIITNVPSKLVARSSSRTPAHELHSPALFGTYKFKINNK
jgi:hypothetical protein